MKTIRFIAVLLLFFAGMTAQAQQAVEDFQRINAAYQQLSSLSMDVEYKVYQSAKAQEPIQVEQGKLLRQAGKTYHKLGEVETISTPDYQLMVDHANQFLLLSPGGKTNFTVGDDFAKQLETLLKYCEKVDYQELKQGRARYTLQVPVGEYDQMVIDFERKSFLIQKIALYYREARSLQEDGGGAPDKPRLEMLYSNIQTKVQVPDNQFSYAPFLSKVKDQYQLRKEFQQYQFVNQLQ